MFFAKSNGFISFGDVISWHHTPVILFFFVLVVLKSCCVPKKNSRGIAADRNSLIKK